MTTEQLDTCDKEPIHALSRVQQNGILLVVSYDNFKVLQASDNCASITNASANEMLQKDLKHFFALEFIEHLHSTLNNLLSQKVNFGTLYEKINSQKLFCAIHCEELFIILEMSYDTFVYDSNYLSTKNIVSKAIGHCEAHATLEMLLQSITKSVQEISQFDRVMIYKFDEDYNGIVLAQENHILQENYLGHCFPASDIPVQARALYLKNTFRIIEDVNELSSVIIPTLNPLTDEPIDMSFCYCRGVSPIHLEYLRNMGVRSSMSISLIIGGKLWGLIACHHPVAKKINIKLYSAYYILSKLFSMQIEQKENLLHYKLAFELRIKRELYISKLESKNESNFQDAIAQEIDSLKQIISCDAVALYYDHNFIRDTKKLSNSDLKILLNIIKENLVGNYFQSSHLGTQFPQTKNLSTKIGGIIGIKVPNIHNTYLLFIRQEQAQIITWAGEPQKQIRYEKGMKIIEPRASFESWKEVVTGSSAPFLFEESDSALLLSKKLFTIHKQFQLHEEAEKLRKKLEKQEELLLKNRIDEKILKERELLLDMIGEGVYGVDINDNCFFINPRACAILGFTKEDIIGKNAHQLFHHTRVDGSYFPMNECIIHTAITQNKQIEMQDWLIRKSGDMFPARMIATPLHKDGNLSGAVVSFSDITLQYTAECKLKELNKKLEYESTTDPLTQIYNRRYFAEYGNLEFERCKNNNLPLSIITMDIDFFKKINDSYGHEAGDRVLVEVANVTKSQLREHDVFARVGGEEFTIILPECSLAKSIEIAQRIKDSIAKKSININEKSISCTVSLGISTNKNPEESFTDLLRIADEKLYQAKENGRNRIEVSSCN